MLCDMPGFVSGQVSIDELPEASVVCQSIEIGVCSGVKIAVGCCEEAVDCGTFRSLGLGPLRFRYRNICCVDG